MARRSAPSSSRCVPKAWRKRVRVHVGRKSAQDGDALDDAADAARGQPRLAAFGQAAQLQIHKQRRSLHWLFFAGCGQRADRVPPNTCAAHRRPRRPAAHSAAFVLCRAPGSPHWPSECRRGSVPSARHCGCRIHKAFPESPGRAPANWLHRRAPNRPRGSSARWRARAADALAAAAWTRAMLHSARCIWCAPAT